MRQFTPRFLLAVLYFGLLTAVGVTGYLLVEGWSFHDSLYMTVTTLTAVGYQEVRPLSFAGRNFTMVLLAGGITGMGIWFALITAFLVELDLKNVLRRRRMMKNIEGMSDHVVVCGAGRTGRQVIEELVGLGQDFVLVEEDSGRVERVLELIPDAHAITGDATVDRILEQAGVKRARGIITCLGADADNLFVCLSARDLNPDLVIIARSYEEQTTHKLFRAGADHVISPNVSGAIQMVSVLLRPAVVSLMEVATRSTELDLRLEEATIHEDSPVAGSTLGEARIPQETGLIVIALRKAAGEGRTTEEERLVFNPVAATSLEPGDDLIVLGNEEQVRTLRSHVSA